MAVSDGTIKNREIVEEMQESYLDYAMSVIVARALPDIRDGLKPVHRRILYSMHEMGLRPNAKFRKSATVVGFVLGRYHPHGDAAAYDSLVRMAQDFSLRYPLVEGQGNFGCFTGDTKVTLTDGREITFIDLVKETQKGKKNYTYTFNHKSNSVEIYEIKNPRLTKKNAELIEVTLDNGEKIRCTPDHRFMLRGGGYKKAQFLKNDDSLMPANFRFSTAGDDKNAVGYKMIWQPAKRVWDWAHRLADQFNINHEIYKKSDGRVRHHVDFNKLNNNPSNIRRMHWADHWQLHSKLMSDRHRNDPEYVARLKKGRDAFWADPKNRERNAKTLSDRSKKWWQDPQYKKQKIEAVRKLWTNPKYREFMKVASGNNLKKLWRTEEFKKLLSKIKSHELKVRWQDRDYRERMTELMREQSNKLWSNPDHRTAISSSMKKKWQDDKYRAYHVEVSKRLWQDKNYREKYKPNHFSRMAKILWSNPATGVFHSEKAKKQWSDPNFRGKVLSNLRIHNKKFLEKNPDFMSKIAKKAKTSLLSKWRDSRHKERVIKSRILGFVNGLIINRGEITPEIYNSSRDNNCIPKLETAIKYFSDFQDLLNQAKTYNHKVVNVRFLKEREDVYDLTIENSHNFALAAGIFVHNSVDGDPPAAYRYTESKLASISEMLLADIEKDTVDFRDNFDATAREPQVLPARVPNLLINGSMGIAVGMATNIPPHNLSEVIDGLVHLIDSPDSDVNDLNQFIKGPDFPTGGTIYNEKDILNTYATGKGPIVMRAKADIVESEKKGFQIIISEIPYQVNKAELIVHIAELVKEKKVEGIRDVRDESDKDGLRVAVDLKNDAFPRKVLNQLFKYTELQKSFHVNMLGLVDGMQPHILSLKSLLEKFIEHRQSVIVRRTKFDLGKAKDRAHILEGLKKALDHIDEIIKIIKKSDSKEDAARNLIKQFKFSDKQTSAILEMRLQALAGLERKRIEEELKDKKEMIAFLEDLLAHPKKILGVVKSEFLEIKQKYGDERRTKIVKAPLREIGEEELIPEENSLFMLTHGGYMKRIPPDTLKAQKRGGKGLIGIATKEEDVVGQFFIANTHDNILFFTNSGKVFQTKGYEIPESTRQAKGKAIVNFLQTTPTDRITAVVPLAKNSAAKYLVMVTANGVIKKVDIDEFSQVRRSGMIALKLKGDDELKWVKTNSSSDEIILTTSDGMAIRFKEKDVRPMGRAAAGVIGVKLNKNEKVVGADVIPAGKEAKGLKLLAVMSHGYGKRTEITAYKVQKRGGKGVMTAKITAKTGSLVSAQVTSEENKELIAVSQKGQVIRTELDSVSILGRATQGVRVMKLDDGDALASIVVI